MYFYEQAVTDVQYTDRSLKFTVESKENFLGIITVDHINNLIPVSTDSLIFTIRNLETGIEIGKNIYEVDNVFYFDSIPFGFEVQTNSSNQDYQIELSATCDAPSCTFGNLDSTVTLRHYFPKSLIISDPALVIHFLSEKLISGIREASTPDTWQLFIIPVVIYFILAWVISDHIQNIFTLLRKIDILIIFVITLDVLLQNSLIFWFSLFFVLLRCRVKMPLNILLLVSICFILTIALYLAGLNQQATRMGTWIFIFTAIYLLNLTGKY